MENKIKYYFTNHAPVVFTINEIEIGRARDLVVRTGSSVKVRALYTGLKDKHGNEIYEGDILRCDASEQLCKIIWYGAEWGMFWDDLSYTSTGGSLNDCEVVGDIYENPDLLSDKNK